LWRVTAFHRISKAAVLILISTLMVTSGCDHQ
jgi:hypothetical protein